MDVDVPMRPGANGGQLRTGNPGNVGGGRPPDAFKAMCRELASSERVVAMLTRILSDAEHEHFMPALRWASEHGYGKPTETTRVKHTGRLVVAFAAEGRRGKGQ